MAFNRKDRERRGGRDPFAHLHDERAEAEDGDPWFLAPDEGPDIDVQAGVSSNLRQDDLGKRVERSDRAERIERAERAYQPDKATEHPRPTPPMSVSIPPAPAAAPPVAWADPPMTQAQPVVVPAPERLPEPPPPPMPPAAPALPELPEPAATQLQPAIPVDDEPLAKRNDLAETMAFEPAAPAFEVPGFKLPEPIPVLAEPFDFAAALDDRASNPDDPVDYASEVDLDVLSAAVAALGRNKPSGDVPAERPGESDVPPTEEMTVVEQGDIRPTPEADQL